MDGFVTLPLDGPGYHAAANLLLPIVWAGAGNKCEFGSSSVKVKTGRIAVALVPVAGLNLQLDCNEPAPAPFSICFSCTNTVMAGFILMDCIAGFVAMAVDSFAVWVVGKVSGAIVGLVEAGVARWSPGFWLRRPGSSAGDWCRAGQPSGRGRGRERGCAGKHGPRRARGMDNRQPAGLLLRPSLDRLGRLAERRRQRLHFAAADGSGAADKGSQVGVIAKRTYRIQSGRCSVAEEQVALVEAPRVADDNLSWPTTSTPS